MPPDFTDEGLRAALQIRAAHPNIGIVVLSQHLQRRYAVELIADKAGGVGYLLKQRIADTAAAWLLWFALGAAAIWSARTVSLTAPPRG